MPTDRLTEIIAEAEEQWLANYPSNASPQQQHDYASKREYVAQRIRQALREEPVKAFGLIQVGWCSEDSPENGGLWAEPREGDRPVYALPQEEGEKDE